MSRDAGVSSVQGGSPLPSRSYSDIILAFGVVAIVALMILPLPLWVIDILVAMNILIAVSLVLLAIYIPAPTAFSSFPSVILLTTLFRLSLSIAITRLILLHADAGDIIETFGRMVVGGNMVVGIVVFLIITVVQFIVIAKGAERVAEVAARFTLDAMPGKQLSIDSDLRSGLISKDDARRKRRMLELESQLHGSLDGAMKFVKGDAIAGIVILIVNVLGGLAVGVLQRGLTLADAVQTYSILTIGDGLVAQIPALMTSISAGLIITRTGSDDQDSHVGAAIVRQFSSYPRVITIGGVLAILLVFVPGFPWPVFLVMGLLLLGYAGLRPQTGFLNRFVQLPGRQKADADNQEPAELADLSPPETLVLVMDQRVLDHWTREQLATRLHQVVVEIRNDFGVPLPLPSLQLRSLPVSLSYRLEAHGVRIASGVLHSHAVLRLGASTDSPQDQAPAGLPAPEFLPMIAGEWLTAESAIEGAQTTSNTQSEKPTTQEVASIAAHSKVDASRRQTALENDESAAGKMLSAEDVLALHLKRALERHLGLFLGIQEIANLVNSWNSEYPDLIKEMLRVVTPQRLTDVLKRLVQEGVSIRNLRDIFEAITDVGSREKDIVLLTEQVRIMLRRQLSDRYGGATRQLSALLVHPELEDHLRQSVRNTPGGSQLAVDPELFKRILAQLRDLRLRFGGDLSQLVLLCSVDIRRHIRRLTEEEYYELPVLSYQELTADVRIEPVGQLGG